MQRLAAVLCLLVLRSVWTLPEPESLPPTQENFDLVQFMGRWYEVSVASTCPYYLERKRGNPVTLALELKHVSSENNFTITTSTFRNGSCHESVTIYSLTNTPGRFFHHFAKFGADVDSFVVHSNYNEYAMMLQLSTEKPSGTKTIKVKLYSRTVDVSPAVLEDFKALIRQHGMSDDALIVNQYKGECVPGQQETEPISQPQADAF